MRLASWPASIHLRSLGGLLTLHYPLTILGRFVTATSAFGQPITHATPKGVLLPMLGSTGHCICP